VTAASAAGVELYLSTGGGAGWVLVGAKDAPPFTFTLATADLPDGPIQAMAIAYDAGGAAGVPLTHVYRFPLETPLAPTVTGPYPVFWKYTY